MPELSKFLDNYDAVIFDMDGVVTSEDNYWTSAALTVWESMFGEKYSVNQMSDDAVNIRNKVFCDDRLISLLKNKGVNSNWDLAYVVYAVSKIEDTTDFDKIFKVCHSFSDNILNEYKLLGDSLTRATGKDGTRNGILWQELMMCFQEWYLGDNLFNEVYLREPVRSGKKGLISNEKPVIDSDALISVFRLLSKTDKRIAIATGRPKAELITPIKNFGIYDYFAQDGIVTYDFVKNVEERTRQSLTKPHPYVFLKALLGEGYRDEDILDGNYDKNLITKTLVVGDAGADMFAAKAIGADFCAVLTGVSGNSARAYFEENNAKYILDSIIDFIV